MGAIYLRASGVLLALLPAVAAARLLVPAPPATAGAARSAAMTTIGLCELVRWLRPALAPRGITTACIAPLRGTRLPRRIGRRHTVTVRCAGSVCTEIIQRDGGAALDNPARRIASLANHYGRSSDVRSIALAAGEWRGFLSVWRGVSSYAPGAAYSNNQLTCETYHAAIGRVRSLRTLIGSRAAGALRAAAAALHDHLDGARYRVAPGSFRLQPVPGGSQIVLCAVVRHHRDATLLEVPLAGVWKPAP